MTERIRQSLTVQRLVEKIRDHSRQMQALEREIEKKQAEVRKMRNLGQEKYAGRENDLINLSMMVMQLGEGGDGGVNAEQIFLDSDDPIITRRRHTMQDMITTLRFLYAFDNTDELTVDMQRVVNEATQDWNVLVPARADN